MSEGHFISAFGNLVTLRIDGETYEYEMANENMAAKAQWLFQHKPFWGIFNGWLKRMRVNERRIN